MRKLRVQFIPWTSTISGLPTPPLRRVFTCRRAAFTKSSRYISSHDHMTISVRKRKNDHYREGHIVYIAKSGKVICPVTMTRRLLVHLTGSSSETPLIRKIVKYKKSECFRPTKEISTTTNREEFNTHVLPFAVNTQQLSMHSLKSAWCSMELGLLFITL